MVSGEVLMNNQPAHRSLARFIEKKIHKWAEATEHIPLNELAYKVAFTEDDVKHISCETEIIVGENIWRGFELASDSQLAFISSLKRLQQH
jgi:hypothetical protein